MTSKHPTELSFCETCSVKTIHEHKSWKLSRGDHPTGDRRLKADWHCTGHGAPVSS